MVDTPSLIVSLRRTYRYQGKTYGPGADIEVPYGLAASLGLLPRVPATVPATVPAAESTNESAAESAAEFANEPVRRGRKPKTAVEATE